MSKILVIVESPAKAKTFRKYLGSGFDVDSSVGHIRDLPKKDMGFDLESFKPSYEINKDKKQVVARLRKKAKTASKVLLATDLDREGEAIAWHLKQVLNLKNKPYARIIFNEVTKTALQKAIKDERAIDMQLVAAQETRRLLDRFVGYTISPWLTNTLTGHGKLSGGRVQSVALRLVVVRDREINDFVPETYYVITVDLDSDGLSWKATLDPATVNRSNLIPVGEDSNVPNGHLTSAHVAEQISDFLLEKGYLTVSDVEEKETKSVAPAPFTTSSLQQAASNQLGFNPKLTMSVAQALYEAGKITYMRTDTKNLGDEAIDNIRKFIMLYSQKKGLSAKYLPDKPNRFASGENAQEAHEAIRPADVFDFGKDIEGRTPKDTERMKALYQLIWRRTIACQMAPALYDKKTISLVSPSDPNNGQPYQLSAQGSTLKFKGWRLIMAEDTTAENEQKNETPSNQALPMVKIGDHPPISSATPVDKSTRPPSYFNEASLVKALEKAGVGRPSTYASTIDRLFNKKYIVTLKGQGKKAQIAPTELGCAVESKMSNCFSFMEYGYTRKIESSLDEIASGSNSFKNVLSQEINMLTRELNAIDGLSKAKSFEKKLTILKEECPSCGSGQVVVRDGRSGPFGGCTRYPECKYNERLE